MRSEPSREPLLPRQEADASGARAPILPPDQARAIALQRSAGNRAVVRLLSRVVAPAIMLQRAEAEDLEEISQIAAEERGSTLGSMLTEVLSVAPKIGEWKPVPTSGYVVKRNDEDVDD